MKINKSIIIEGKEFDNQFYLSLDFNQDKLPILKIKRHNIILPITTDTVISLLKNRTISNMGFLNPISIVQNEALDFVDFVETNSVEYKKLITSNSFRTDKIKQGTLVKLQSGEIYIFLQTIKLANMYQFERIFDHLDINSKKQIKNLFKTSNLFWNPVENRFVLFNNTVSSKRVIECYDVIPEYSEKTYNVKENYYKTLTKIISLDELKFINEDNNSYFKIKEEERNFLSRYWGIYYQVISFNSKDFNLLFDFLKFN